MPSKKKSGVEDFTDLVRYRNDGDDFHIVWTARRCLQLLRDASGLSAVAIEGISNAEGLTAKHSDGVLAVDTAEYYGSENLKHATKVIYYQLKYSTKNSTVPWPASGLTGTVAEFARRYRKIASVGPSKVSVKARFCFVSNRPISKNVVAALAIASSGRSLSGAAKAVKSTYKALHDASGLGKDEFSLFAKQFDLLGMSEGRTEQADKLAAEYQRYSPILDPQAAEAMKRLVRSRTFSEAKHANVIRRESILRALGLGGSGKELFPAESSIAPLTLNLHRKIDTKIVQKIISSSHPVIVEAEGGVGKTAFAQRIKAYLPAGSELVIFDGFASGAYRGPRDLRHKADVGITQIANEIAGKGLCDILLPNVSARPEDYQRALWIRLEQAASALRLKNKSALMVVVLDAADNSGMAAEEHLHQSFVPNLLRDIPPPGCKIVALARPYRVKKYLQPSGSNVLLSLGSFSLEESTALLRSKFPSVSQDLAKTFHRLTDKNPRVQANAIAAATTEAELVEKLGTSVKSVDSLISDQLESAFKKVLSEQVAGSGDVVKQLCQALAILPPPIPIQTLAHAAGMETSAIRSFASDFGGGRPVQVVDDRIQFRDEPVETWFKERFAIDAAAAERVSASLQPSYQTDQYAATVQPILYWHAQKYGDLVALATTGGAPNFDDPVAQRDIVLSRVQYALRASLKKQNATDTAKLLLRAGEATATNDRQTDFLLSNFFLVGALSDPQSANDFIYKKRPWVHERYGYEHCALLLSEQPGGEFEAKKFLKLALSHLYDWAEKRRANDPKARDLGAGRIAIYVLAIAALEGAPAAVKFIKQWKPKSLWRDIAAEVSHFLSSVDTRGTEYELFRAAKAEPLVASAFLTNRPPSKESISKAEFEAVLKGLADTIDGGKADNEQRIGLFEWANLLELGVQLKISRRLIQRILKTLPTHVSEYVDHWDTDGTRRAFLRIAALRSELVGGEFNLEAIAPEKIRKVLSETGGPDRDEVRRFKSFYSPLLPWYNVRASVLAGSGGRATMLAFVAAPPTGSIYEWSAAQGTRSILMEEIGRIWADCLERCRIFTPHNLAKIEEWFSKGERSGSVTFWTDLCRIAARSPKTHKLALQMAVSAEKLNSFQNREARESANGLAHIARALLAVQRREATVYFEMALQQLDRLGHDFHDSLYSMLGIANHIGSGTVEYPELAYKLARAAELFEAHNDHKFPWDQVAISLGKLSAPSAIAIISRWKDRNVGSDREALPQLLISLMSDGKIPATTTAALHTFDGYWSIYENADLFLSSARNPKEAQEIFNRLCRDIELDLNFSSSSAEALIAAGGRRGFVDASLPELLKRESLLKSSKERTETWRDRGPRRSTESFSWSSRLRSNHLLDSGKLAAVIRKAKVAPGIVDWDGFGKVAAKITSVANFPAVYRNIVECSEIPVPYVCKVLRQLGVERSNSKISKKDCSVAIATFLAVRGPEIVESQWSISEVLKLAENAGTDRASLLRGIVQSNSESIANISSGILYYLARALVASELRPEASTEVLEFCFDRLKDIHKESDGDGPWVEALAPRASALEAIAELLFVRLSSPHPEQRWKAAHAIRRMCDLGDCSAIGTLISRYQSEEVTPFNDRRLPAYKWHGRLYLMITIARIAREKPEAIRPHVDFLLSVIERGPPHVLVHEFAKSALTTVDGVYRMLSSTQRQKVKNTNKSQLASVPRLKSGTGWGGNQAERVRFSFDYDFDRYWMGPVAEVFNQSVGEIRKRLEEWISKWDASATGRWDEDPRRHMYGDGLRTYSNHGSYPEVDRYSFYLGYHSLFCAAGELLKSLPTADPEWRHGTWGAWVADHCLTRSDGEWLADRRDPNPQSLRRWQLEVVPWERRAEWKFEITVRDFDEALFAAADMPDGINLYGSWVVSSGSNKESIRINSAIVSPTRASALLRAFQCSRDLQTLFLPLEWGDAEVFQQEFWLRGWVRDIDVSANLDRFDTAAGFTPWPGPLPGRRARKLLDLQHSHDYRHWYSNGQKVGTLRLWGDRQDRPSGGNYDYGERISADKAFVQEALKRLQASLILEVEIERDDGEKNNEIEYRYRDYCRYYIYRQDGSIETAGRHPRVREGDRPAARRRKKQ